MPHDVNTIMRRLIMDQGAGVQKLKDGKILSPDINPKEDPGKKTEKARKEEIGIMDRILQTQ
jgi:hypothetical protein